MNHTTTTTSVQNKCHKNRCDLYRENIGFAFVWSVCFNLRLQSNLISLLLHVPMDVNEEFTAESFTP